MVAADKEGVSPRELADRNNADHPRRPPPSRALVRPVHADDDAEPPSRRARRVPHPLGPRLHLRAEDSRGVLRLHRPDIARSLHRRDVPDLRFPVGARRPVRQLRQPARPGGPDRAALEGRRRSRRCSARRRTCSSTCRHSRSSSPSGSASRSTGGRTSASSRSQLVRELKPRPVTRDLDWGVRIPVPGYEEREDKRIYVWIDAVIGYLSAAVEWARNRGTPDAWREWWQNPDARHFYFMGKDNIVFHSVIWPSQLLGYGTGGELGAGRHARAAVRHRGERVSDDGGQAVLHQPQRRHPRRRLPERYDADSPAVLPHGRRPRDARHRLHVGGVRPAEQRRARRELGESRQPDAPERLRAFRLRARAGRAHGRRRPR